MIIDVAMESERKQTIGRIDSDEERSRERVFKVSVGMVLVVCPTRPTAFSGS